MCVSILIRLKSDKVTEKGEIRHFIPVSHCVGSNNRHEVVISRRMKLGRSVTAASLCDEQYGQ